MMMAFCMNGFSLFGNRMRATTKWFVSVLFFVFAYFIKCRMKKKIDERRKHGPENKRECVHV